MTHQSTSSALLELAERVEKATGPDRVIDGEVFKALFDAPQYAWKNDWGDCPGVWYREDEADPCAWESPPTYTASIDAAKSLMPEGVMVEVYQQSGDSLNWMTKAIFADGSFVLGYGFTEEGSRCAAALTARATGAER